MTAEAGPPVRANVLEERVLYVDGIRRGNRALHAASIRERQLMSSRLVSCRLTSRRQKDEARRRHRKHRLHRCLVFIDFPSLTQ